MLPDRVSNPGPLTYESGVLPIALRGPAEAVIYLNFGTPKNDEFSIWNKWKIYYFRCPNT